MSDSNPDSNIYITDKNFDIRKLSIELLNDFYLSGILSYAITFDQVTKNGSLLKLLIKTLGKGLSEDPKTSEFGYCYLSDFDVFFSGKTNANLTALLQSEKYKDALGGSVTLDRVKIFQTKRNKLFKKMEDLLWEVIYNWELTGTPDPNEEIAKPVKTKKIVEKEIDNKKTKLIQENSADKKSIKKQRININY